MAKEILFSFELEPGMVVCEDIFDPKGRLILSKGTALNNDAINKLEYFSILEVPIDTSIEAIPDVEEIIMEATATSSIKDTEEFKLFSEDYDKTIDTTKSILDSVAISHADADTDAIVNAVNSLTNTCNNSMQMLDMLHNIETNDEQTYHHCLKVALIAQVLGKWLGVSQEDLDQLAIAGILHDIGKLAIPQEVLNKKSKLTNIEYELVKSHVVRGYEYIKDMDLDIRVKEACLLHHERCDGSGYPFKVKSDRISPFAKIIAIADVYDAMTSSRAYRKSFCPFDVIQLFDSEGLYKYDPQYIMTFLENIVSSYVNSRVRLSDGREGEIILINKICLYKPIVKVGNEFVDLSRQSGLKIADVL